MSVLFGGGGSTTVSQPARLTAQEKELLRINTQLAKSQLENVNALQPFQKELLALSLADLRRNAADAKALDAAISPADRAAMQKAEFERAQRLGPIQDELMQLQLEQLRSGGAATPEQIARIREATDAGIEAGSYDIDMQTSRGIGLIADELANSRGLRLSDSPIMREATLLARSGEDQKASLIKNLRASEASSRLNFPLAVQQLQSGINLNQQNVNAAASQFQADLRQRAYQNRLALSGQTSGTGIGLASVRGPGMQYRGGGTTSSTRDASGAELIQNVGSIATGIGALMAFSDRRLKKDYGVVGKTSDGIDLHVYRYKGEDERDPLRLGVMADEVEKVKPGAVSKHSSGYSVVDLVRVFDRDGIGLASA